MTPANNDYMSHSGADPPIQGPRIAVVLVDGHTALRDQLAACLRDAGLDVVAAVSTLREARAAVTRHDPDVIVADCRLPDGPGNQLCRIHSQVPRHAPVLLHSATLTPAQVRDGRTAGAAEVLLKNIRCGALVTAIHRHARPQTAPLPTG